MKDSFLTFWKIQCTKWLIIWDIMIILIGEMLQTKHVFSLFEQELDQKYGEFNFSLSHQQEKLSFSSINFHKSILSWFKEKQINMQQLWYMLKTIAFIQMRKLFFAFLNWFWSYIVVNGIEIHITKMQFFFHLIR